MRSRCWLVGRACWALCGKDLDLIKKLGQQTGTQMDITLFAHNKFEEARNEFGDEQAELLVYKMIEEASGVDLRVEGSGKNTEKSNGNGPFVFWLVGLVYFKNMSKLARRKRLLISQAKVLPIGEVYARKGDLRRAAYGGSCGGGGVAEIAIAINQQGEASGV